MLGWNKTVTTDRRSSLEFKGDSCGSCQHFAGFSWRRSVFHARNGKGGGIENRQLRYRNANKRHAERTKNIPPAARSGGCDQEVVEMSYADRLAWNPSLVQGSLIALVMHEASSCSL